MSENDPFSAIPFFGDLAKMLGSQGPVSWDTARQIAYNVATEGQAEPNVDPMARIALEQLSRVAVLQVANVSGLDVGLGGAITPVTRTQWVARALDDTRVRFESLANTLGNPADSGDSPLGNDDETDEGAFLTQLMGLVQPMTMGLAAGSMIGHLALRSFGQYELPIPRPDGAAIMVQVGVIDAFASDWSLPVEGVRLWVCLHEMAHDAVLNLPHVRARFDELVTGYITGFKPDAGAFERALGELDTDDANPDDAPSMAGMAAFQRLFSNPELLLGATTSPAQAELRPQLDTLVALVVGWVDHVMDRVGTGLVDQYPQVTEAMRRRRVETSEADRYVERLLGLNLTQAQVDAGSAFVKGVLDRAGEEGLARLWERSENLPTPAELDASGLWLARIDLNQNP